MSQEDWDMVERHKEEIINDHAFVDLWVKDDIESQLEDGVTLSDNELKAVIIWLNDNYSPADGVCWEKIDSAIEAVLS